MGDLIRERMLEIAGTVTVVGFLLTVVSYTAYLADPGFLAGYEEALRGGWNLWIMAISPFVLLMGGWYAGEQILLRRRFEEHIAMERRSESRDRIRELEDIVRKLPSRYEQRLVEETEEFR
jgi:hypothetical protein